MTRPAGKGRPLPVRGLAVPGLVAAALALALGVSGVLNPAELPLRDALLRALPARPATRMAVVLVDEPALRAAGPWPWGRAQLARLVDAVVEAGARGVVVDLLLPEPRPGDAELQRALARGPAVLAAGLDEDGSFLMPQPGFHPGAIGHVSFDLDRDGVVRRFSATRQAGTRSLPALPVAAARLADPRLPVPAGVNLRPGPFRARPVPTTGAGAVLAGGGAGALRGRIVFLGVCAAGLGDRFVSPVSPGGSPDPGVLIEALSAEAVLAGDLLRPAGPLGNALLAFALGLLGAGLLAVPGRWARLAPAVVLAPVPLAAAALAWFRIELAPLAMTAGLGLAGALAAVDRWRRAGRAMGQARRRIAELEGLQAGLARDRARDAEARRVVAHELKTPLTSMKGLAQLLAQFDLTGPERDRVARLVAAESTRLALMVDALLDLERLGLRDFGRDARALDLSALAAARADILRAGAGRELATAIEPGLGVLGDPMLLERVVDNLVGNAVKFSPDGTPVRLGLRREDGWAVLEVADRGPGVPEAERERIFGRFARGSAQALAPGLGLGLALVAEVAAWHGGTVAVDGAPGGGSVFRARLPLLSQPGDRG